MRRTLIANRARAMRKGLTEPEIMLWSRLKGRGQDKPTFRCQHPFGNMIFDFYCPAARLAIEVDGSTHWDEAAQAKDEARDRWLGARESPCTACRRRGSIATSMAWPLR